MPRTFTRAATVALLGLAASSSYAAVPPAGGIMGYLDPATGSFRPALTAGPAAAASSVTGKFIVKFTISVQSPIGSTSPITCSVTASSFGTSGSIVESGTAPATRSGASATCTVQISYKFPSAPAGTTVSLSYAIQGGSTTFRISDQPIATIAVPASGATTSYSLTPVL